MSVSALKGGLNALMKLGCTHVDGVSTRTTSRSWSMNDNGNPSHMLQFVRDFISDDVLFTIERDFNRNVILMSPSLDATGNLNTVKASWFMVPSDVDIECEETHGSLYEEELTKLEYMGYGVTNVVPNTPSFCVAALPDTPLNLVRDPVTQKWRVCITIENVTWMLQRILLYTKPRALGMFPSVTELHLEVADASGAVAQFYYAVK